MSKEVLPQENKVYWAILAERNWPGEGGNALIDVATVAGARGYHRIKLPYMRVEMARNLYVQAFLKHAENDDDTLIMLDLDHKHPPDILDRLARFPGKLGVVGALAYRRGGNHDPMFFFANDQGQLQGAKEWDHDGVYQCDAVATCAIAIKRWVFKRLDEAGYPWPYFRYEYPETGAVPSEDIVFARACMAAGIPHHCDTSTMTPHLIDAVADGSQWRALLAEQAERERFAEAPPREEFPGLLTEIGATVGAEIGVQRGEFSEHLLKNWGGRLYMVDAWEHQSGHYVDPANVSDEEHGANFAETFERVEPYIAGDRAHIIESYSLEAVDHFRDDDLDFIYIDADHAYDAVLADLKAWYPKVRPGGLVAGDDFVNNRHPRFECQVKDAVLDFIKDKNVTLHVSPEPWPRLWYFVKE